LSTSEKFALVRAKAKNGRRNERVVNEAKRGRVSKPARRANRLFSTVQEESYFMAGKGEESRRIRKIAAALAAR